MSNCLAVVVVVASAAAAGGGVPYRDTVAISDAVRARGPRAVVEEFWHDPVALRALLGGVRLADPKWLEVAVLLKPGTDAGASEELDDAFALGLLASPARVLPILRKTWWQRSDSRLCTFEYDSELPGGVDDYITKLETALRRKPQAPRSMREACLTGITETRRRLRKRGAR